MTTPLRKAERACAAWKRKNFRVEGASVNRLVEMIQLDLRNAPRHCRQEISYQEGLRLLMICFKDDSLAFAQRVSEYLQEEN